MGKQGTRPDLDRVQPTAIGSPPDSFRLREMASVPDSASVPSAERERGIEKTDELPRTRGTGSSNPSPSSGESRANLIFGAHPIDDHDRRRGPLGRAEAASMPDRPVLKTFEGFPEPACSKGYAL